jgi:hypothetical protein
MTVRKFDTGATRDAEDGKIDFEGFLSPLVLQRYGEYMNRHRKLADGSLRDSDNWQKGIPLAAYMKSLWRHVKDAWTAHRGYATYSGDDIEEELCAVIFNASGYLHERLKSNLAATQLTQEAQAQGFYNKSVKWAQLTQSWEKKYTPKWNPQWALGELSTHPAAAEALRELEERDIKPWKS